MHKIFYEVSCDREKLIAFLRSGTGDVSSEAVKRWQTLEDLALRHSEETPSFKEVLKMKGREEVDIRKAFLQIPPN